MKLRPVTKLDKRNKTRSKQFNDSIMSSYFDVIVIFPIYGQFGAIRMPDSRGIACKTYIFINSNLLCYKNFTYFYLTFIFYLEERTKESLTQLSHCCFE